MTILHVYKDYFPVVGGIENYVRTLAEAQARAGHDVTVVAASLTARSSSRLIGGVRVVLAGRWGTLASTPLVPSLAARLRERRAAVTHLHVPYPPGELAYLLSRPQGRTIVTYHSDVVRQRRLRVAYAPILTRLLRLADRIIVTSEAYAKTSPHLRAFLHKCAVVPIGIDVDRFDWRQGTDRAGLRRNLGLPVEEPVVLFVGRLRYYKGLGDLLRAWLDVPHAHLVLVGAGPCERECRALVRRLGLSGRVTLAGHVGDEELPAYYQAADVFVLPSNARAEAFGTALVEAMAARLPVISTEVGSGTSWVNQDGETGLVVPPRDPPALARALTRLLGDRVLRERLGESAGARARALFNVSSMVERVQQIYDEVTGMATGGR